MAITKDFKEKVKRAVSYGYVEVDFYSHFEDYDEKDSISLEGHREKEFYRIDSELFQDLVKELQSNPNCGYVTYLNKIIRDGYVPKKISCMVKRLEPDTKNELKVDDPDLTFKESLASQILNLYGCPTAYNLTVKDKEIQKDYAYTLLSVDMVSNDILTFENLGCDLTNNLAVNLQSIDFHLRKKIMQGELPNTCNNQIIEDYIYSFLIRKFVLQDGDFYEYNGGLLTQENGDIQYVNFDFEHCFFQYFGWPNITKSLTLVKEKYPHIYEDFNLITQKIYNTLLDLMNNEEIEYISDEHYRNINLLLKNLRMSVLACNRLNTIAVQ